MWLNIMHENISEIGQRIIWISEIPLRMDFELTNFDTHDAWKVLNYCLAIIPSFLSKNSNYGSLKPRQSKSFTYSKVFLQYSAVVKSLSFTFLI